MEPDTSIQSPFSALNSVPSLSLSPRLTRRTPSPLNYFGFFDDPKEIRNKNSSIVTFSKLIDEWVYLYEIAINSEFITVYTGMITPEKPDNCNCLVEIYKTKNFKPQRLLVNYNICYKQYYLFSRIFKKMSCKGGKCITHPSNEEGRIHRFTQNSYCCGYYSAVAAVMYRYYQIQSHKFPGTKYNINFEKLTLAQINNIVDDFSSTRVNDMLIKLFNLSLSYTSYFSSYITENPLRSIRSNFPDVTNQNCKFNYDNDIIQLATIYARNSGTTMYHHFCTYNKNNHIIISDSWAASKHRRPLWTRFVSASDFSYITNMIQNNSTLSSEQLEIIKKFFLQPHGSSFVPNIKICYITVDFNIQNDNLFYENGKKIELNHLSYLMGGKTKRSRKTI